MAGEHNCSGEIICQSKQLQIYKSYPRGKRAILPFAFALFR
jgi:hypothetical protein